MDPLLVAAMAAISLALLFYTLGVFAERRAGTLKGRHLALFWLGFALDTTGTSIMTVMAQQSGGVQSVVHAVSGVLAIGLMLFHAVWASVVIARNDERLRAGFHRLSICVWLFWLVPYGIGMLMGIPATHLDAASATVVTCVAVGALALVFCLKARRGGRVEKSRR